MADFELPDIKKDVEDPVDDLKVEIVDDTPDSDKNRKPLPKEIVEEIENDQLDDYSEKVQNRIKQMKKVWHDERRAKETASREKEEALRFAQQAYEENKQLKQRLGVNERAFIHEATRAATGDLAAAKDRLKQAFESGDSSLLADAQEHLTDVKLKLREVEKFKPSLQESETGVQPQQQRQVSPQVVDPKAEAWRQRNTWFGGNEEMTALALGLHQKLVKSGVDSRSEEYYRQIDSTMRKRFPEEFLDTGSPTEEREEKPTLRRSPTVVAPATRTTAPRQIRLSSSQAAIAKRLGLTPEAYAREVMKLENNNG